MSGALPPRREEAARNVLQPSAIDVLCRGEPVPARVDELNALSIATTGERVLMLTGLGATETGPLRSRSAETGGASGTVDRNTCASL